jgi:low affinity Fe/Cu permease
MTLKEVFELIDDLRQELRERAEAHEEAVAMESETASELWELRKMVER